MDLRFFLLNVPFFQAIPWGYRCVGSRMLGHCEPIISLFQQPFLLESRDVFYKAVPDFVAMGGPVD